MNNRSIIREEAFAKLMESKQNAVLDALNEQNILLADHIGYVAKEITGASGIYRITAPDGKKLVGIQSFSANVLDVDEHEVIDMIKVEYAEETKDALKAESANYIDAAPAALLNADVVIKQKNELIRIPFAELNNRNTTPNNIDKYREIGHRPILLAGVPFDIFIEFPDGVSVETTKDHFVRVSWRSFKLIR